MAFRSYHTHKKFAPIVYKLIDRSLFRCFMSNQSMSILSNKNFHFEVATQILQNIKRNVSTSLITRTKTNSKHDSAPNLADDKEFQNLLKDFSKDFGFGKESADILQDIKKSIEEEKAENEKTNFHSSLPKADISKATDERFKVFEDTDTVVIPSFEETDSIDEEEQFYHVDRTDSYDIFEQHLPRGVSGVFDIDEIVEVLRKQNLLDIAVIAVPPEIHYTDFLVLVTAQSLRHSLAVAEFIKKLYKRKKVKQDPFVKIEGMDTSSWKVMDMGNIVLHIFLDETRKYYDIESLWLLDSNYDTQGTLKPDPAFEAIQEEMDFFSTLKKNSEPSEEPENKS